MAFIDLLADAVADRLNELILGATLNIDDLGIGPMKVYSVEETAQILSCSPAAVRQIPEAELPKVRRVGTGIGFLGVNIMLYSHHRPPIDTGTVLEKYRESLLREWSDVVPLPNGSNGLTS